MCLAPIRRAPSLTWTQGRATLMLVCEPGTPPLSGERDNAFYLALRVSGLDAIVTRLTHAGVTLHSVPVSTPYGVRLAVIADPDGTVLHLVEGDFIKSLGGDPRL
ncbi:MAG: hypothetical protein KatS3mg051_0715 [Anaerolineae bacterium]|nr:MAG: hypothetical protein KatS3mg051_0715 [Anaerolineae bacterium]